MSPRSQDLYKITEILKDGFGLKLKNLRTGSEQSVTHEKVRLLSLQDLVATNITEKVSTIHLSYFLRRDTLKEVSPN